MEDYLGGLVDKIVISCSVAELCPTLCNPTDIAHQPPLSIEYSTQESWSGLPFPSLRESSWPRDRTQVSCIAGRLFTTSATREVLEILLNNLKSTRQPPLPHPHKKESSPNCQQDWEKPQTSSSLPGNALRWTSPLSSMNCTSHFSSSYTDSYTDFGSQRMAPPLKS